MNLRSFIILSFFIIATSGYAQNNSDKFAQLEENLVKYQFDFQENPNYKNYDLVYQRMKWDINPEVRYIRGEITSYFKSNADNLSEIEFDLYDGLVVDSVFQNETEVDFSHDQNRIQISLLSPLQKGLLDSVRIYYQGEPAESGFGSFVKDEHEGVPVIWTLSEPYGAMEWWPCKQSLSDKIDSIDIFVTTPEIFRTASNGILFSDKTENGLRTTYWKHRYPIATYLVAIAVTNYSYYSDYLGLENGDSIEILNYVYPENIDYAKSNTPVTAQIMNLYNNIIGEYPFANEKYGHAQFGWGGGMEHQTMSFMGNFNFGLIAHELAHQWFGDFITLGTWQDIWLNEGFATYMAALTIENLKSKNEWFNWRKGTVEKITTYPNGSVFVNDTTDISRIFNSRLSYSKGAYLLHMLRWILGNEAFFDGMRAYFNDSTVQNGFARNYQFVEYMEAAGDTSLTEFFNDWYYGEGYPIYSLNYFQKEDKKLIIQLFQTTTHESVSFFEMPVPVRIYSVDKTDSIDFVLNHFQNDREFEINPGFMVGQIEIDPEYWLISKTSRVTKSFAIEDSGEIVVYPNPFKDEVRVSLLNYMIPSEINLFSVDGKLLHQFSVNQLTSTLKLINLTKGVYILQINTPSVSVKRMLVKQ